MGLQPGEVIAGDHVVFEIEPEFLEYEDLHRDNSTGAAIIREAQTYSRNFKRFPAFDEQYDRFEILEAIRVKSHGYHFTITDSYGITTSDLVTTTAIERGTYDALGDPVNPPTPTLVDVGEIPFYWERFFSSTTTIVFSSIAYDPIPPLSITTYQVEPSIYPFYESADIASGNRIYETVQIYPTIIRYYRKTPKPNYIDLLSGYGLDNRKTPDNPVIIADEDRNVNIGYYRENKFESVPKLRSIDWMTYECKLLKNIPYALPIVDCVLGTLKTDDRTNNDISNLDTEAGKYPYRYYFKSALPEIFAKWSLLYNPKNIQPSANVKEVRMLRVIGGNNDWWHNRSTPTPDKNVDMSHPMFKVDNQRAYDWHIKPQADGSIGNLMVDSTKLREVHAALNAGKYAVNELDPTKPRVATLGWHINRQSEVFGIRVKSDGTIDESLEKTVNRRLHVDGSEKNDPQEYGINSFGSKGIMVRHLPNKFSPSGTAAGGYRKVKDIPQLLAEFHEQANAAVGYQEGTAIEIQLDGETYRYPNQLALLTELLVTAKQTATYSKGAFFSSVVGEQSIKEVMAGLGLRTVDKYIEFNVGGKVAKLYYKGISASQSIRRKLSAVATNIGITIGNII